MEKYDEEDFDLTMIRAIREKKTTKKTNQIKAMILLILFGLSGGCYPTVNSRKLDAK